MREKTDQKVEFRKKTEQTVEFREKIDQTVEFREKTYQTIVLGAHRLRARRTVCKSVFFQKI